MDFQRHTNRRLHEEHVAVSSLLARFREGLQHARDVDALGDEPSRRLLRAVSEALSSEVRPHFLFEERALFPRLVESGEEGLVTLFLDEHAEINGCCAALAPLLQAAQAGGLDATGFTQLRSLGLELCDRLSAHAEQEDGALLPLLEDLLDEDSDRAALEAYNNL